jgi:hypothetical protein
MLSIDVCFLTVRNSVYKFVYQARHVAIPQLQLQGHLHTQLLKFTLYWPHTATVWHTPYRCLVVALLLPGQYFR